MNCTLVLHLAEQGRSNLHVTSQEDAACRRPRERLSNGNARAQVSKPARNIPRRHTLGGPRSSKEILGMQPSEMDRKREAFLEHLKQKYPHHATAIMGHQERLRDQVGTHYRFYWPCSFIKDFKFHVFIHVSVHTSVCGSVCSTYVCVHANLCMYTDVRREGWSVSCPCLSFCSYFGDQSCPDCGYAFG